MRRALYNIGLVLVSCAVTLLGIEIALRYVNLDAPGTRLTEFDPILGWVNRPNARAEFSKPEFSFLVENNSHGMRDEDIGEKRPDEFRVAVLGDSFVWGWGVSFGERFSEVRESIHPRINVLNFGVSGYAPIQFLLQLENVLPLNPDYVILAFSLGSDLTDNLVSIDDPPRPYPALSPDRTLEVIGYPLPRIGYDDDEPGLRIYRVMKRAFDKLQVWFTPDPSLETGLEEEDEEDLIELVHTPAERLNIQQREKVELMYRLNEGILERMQTRIEAALGPGRFAVLLAPSKYEYGVELASGAAGDAVLRGMLESLARLKIPAINGRDAIDQTDFWPGDGHWLPSGHRQIGRLLENHLSGILPETLGRHGAR